MRTITTKNGDMLDLICYNHYGNEVKNALETVLEANAGLARHGNVFPFGVTINLPTITPPLLEKSVRLWD